MSTVAPPAKAHRARWRVLAGSLLAAAAGLAQAQALQGRWEGLAEVPGQPTAVVLDLITTGATPRALLTLPGRAPATPLPSVTREGDRLAARSAASAGAAAIEVRLQAPGPDGLITGHLVYGGHEAPLRLQRTGEPQVAAPPPARPLGPDLQGVWRGRYDLGFGPRDATLTVTAQEAGMRVVGRRSVDVRFDEAVQVGAFVRLTSNETGLVLVAPAAGATASTWSARVRQGPFSAELVLRRESGS